jgi:adenylate cyclase class 2
MVEIERKFRLSDDQALMIKQKLEEKAGALKSIHQVDKVFLRGIDSFKDFKPGMPVVRLRTEGEHTKLTFKRTINQGGDSIEHESGVGSVAAIEAILLETDFRLVTNVVKDRVEVQNDNLTFALDSVEGLGSFIEIEIIADDDKAIAAAERQIMEAATQFGLTEEDIETRKYDVLVASLKK